MAAIPSKRLLMINWLRSSGIFVIAVGVFFIGLTGYRMVSLLDDLRGEDSCRMGLANEAVSLQQEINAKGWEALLEVVAGADDEQTLAKAEEIHDLRGQWRVANDRRSNAEEICD